METQKPEKVTLERKKLEESPLLDTEKIAPGTHQPEQIIISKKETLADQIAWLKLSVEEKASITEDILEEIESTPIYWSQLILSVIIATFGLLQNSVAVIIGAMLIAPLLRPIKGLAFAITTGQPSYLWKAAWMQIFSIVVTISTAYLFSQLIPLKIENSEILARTAPNLLDLFIAIASGTIAILSLYFKKLSEGAAGVAMAASLLPPLAVTGIEMAIGNGSAVRGSLLLFTTNLFAILTIGVLIFLFYGFFPHYEDAKIRSLRISAMLLALLILISFPLFSSFTQITEKINLETQARNAFEETLSSLKGITIGKIQVTSHDKKEVYISGSIKVPTNLNLSIAYQNELQKTLTKEFNREVILELEINPVILIGTQKNTSLP